MRLVDERRRSPARVTTNQIVGDLRSFDRCARYAEAVGEVADGSRHRTPASAHARLADSYLFAIHVPLIDHQIEWKDRRQQLGKGAVLGVAGRGHCIRKWQAERPVDTGHS